HAANHDIPVRDNTQQLIFIDDRDRPRVLDLHHRRHLFQRRLRQGLSHPGSHYLPHLHGSLPISSRLSNSLSAFRTALVERRCPISFALGTRFRRMQSPITASASPSTLRFPNPPQTM